MKVAIDLTALLPLRTGVERYMLGLVEGLAELDDETGYTIFVNHEDRQLLSLPANFSVVAASFRPRVTRLAFQQLVLPLASLAGDVDVIHSPSFIMPLWRGRAAHLLTIHDLTSFTRPECHTWLRRSAAYRCAVRTSVRRANTVSVPSAHVRRELLRLFPDVHESRLAVVPHGLDEWFDSPPVPLPAEIPAAYVLCVGTLEPRKNLTVLVRAYERLAAEGFCEELVLAGKPGWHQDDFWETVERSPARSRIHVVGYVADDVLPSLYAQARAFVYPSLEEGFGFPPLEAMASGVPTVASASSSLAEHLNDAAELVPPSDAEALASTLRRVLRDEDLRGRLRTAGRARAASFRWERAARETRALYGRLADSRRSRRALRAVGG